MPILHAKSPNGIQKDIDLDKIFTTDGGTLTGYLNAPRINLKHDLSKGASPSATKYVAIYMSDKYGDDYGPNCIGLLESSVNASNLSRTYIRALKNEAESTVNCEISCNVDADGNIYTGAPTPATSDNSTKIATTAFVKNQGYTTASGHNHDSAYVKLSGDQTVQGQKTFTADMYFTNAAPKIIQIHTNDTISSKPSSDHEWYLRFYDKNNNNCGGVKHCHDTDNIHWTGITCRDKGETTWSGVIAWNVYSGNRSVVPYTSKTHSLGLSTKLWTTVYAQTATINTSDERAKTMIDPIPDAILDAWENIRLVQYKLKDSISEKGIDNARYHTGCIAQNVYSVFSEKGLDPALYGFYCHDSWDRQPAMYEDGEESAPEIPAGDQFSIRYEEMLIIEAAYQRRRADRLEERVARLEALLESK